MTFPSVDVLIVCQNINENLIPKSHACIVPININKGSWHAVTSIAQDFSNFDIINHWAPTQATFDLSYFYLLNVNFNFFLINFINRHFSMEILYVVGVI